MSEFSFKEEDKQKLVEFLNIVAKNASFTMKTEEIIAYFKLLSHMQNVILPKLNANILEVLKVEEVKKEEKPKREPKASKAE